MKIAIIGAGGVGSILGGRLAQAGVDVTLVARGPHLQAMRERGLTVEQAGEAVTVDPIRVTDDPAEIGPVDAAIVAVKRYDLEDACRRIAGILKPGAPLVPVQNGVTASEAARRAVGASHVVGGMIFSAAYVEAPGRVRQHGAGPTVIFGEPDGTASDRLRALERLGHDAGLDFRLSTDIELDLWRKFVQLAGLNPVCCLSRQTVGTIRDDPNLSALLREAIAEVAAVGRAKGVALPDDIVERTLDSLKPFEPTARSSMLVDMEKGKPLELEWISGDVVRFGANLGVPTPVHRTAYACLKPLAGGSGAGSA